MEATSWRCGRAGRQDPGGSPGAWDGRGPSILGRVGSRSVSFDILCMFDKPGETCLFVCFPNACDVSGAVPSAGNRAGNRLTVLPSRG